MDNGEAIRLEVEAYTDNTFQKGTGEKYKAIINPETFSLRYGTIMDQKSPPGSSESVSAFNRRAPQSLSIKFIFDGTGLAPNAPAGDIVSDFGQFKSVVYSYNKDVHQPRFVQLRWGTLIYNCSLTDMSVNFTLFKASGMPLRAEADCTFQGYIDQKKLAALENRHSPDLTKLKIVIAGDTLPLLCYREYGDSKYYYEIAKYMAKRYNTMIDFKQLKPSSKLYFPHLSES